jgi:predicted nucleotidyltransferase
MSLGIGDLDRIAAELRALPAVEAYLFGSQARGTAGIDSDVDLAVVTSGDDPCDDFQARLQRSVDVRRRLRRALPGRALDVLVFSPTEWHRVLAEQPALASMIVSEGRRLA